MKRIAIVLIGVLLVSAVIAQPGARRGPQDNCRPDRMMMDRGDRGGNHEEMAAIMLTERLDLSTEQADKFFPRFREHQEEMETYRKNIQEAQKEIREKIKDEKEISDSELSKVLNKVNALHSKKDQARFAFINSLGDILDNTQIAKLATAPHDLNNQRKMKKGQRPQWRQ